MKVRISQTCIAAFIAVATAAPAFSQTEQQWLSNLSRTEKTYGAHDTKTAEFLFAVGNYYHEQKQFDKETAMYARAMAIFEKKPGNHSDLLRYYSDRLARVDAEEGKNDTAEKLFKRSIALGDSLPGKEKTYALPDTLAGLAALYQSEGRYQDAESALKERISLRHRFMNAGQVDIANVDLANLYTAWGKFAEAQQVYDQLLHMSPLPPAVKESYTAFMTKAANKNQPAAN